MDGAVKYPDYWLHTSCIFFVCHLDIFNGLQILVLRKIKELGGELKADFHFFAVSYRGEWQLPELFWYEKILFLAKVIKF